MAIWSLTQERVQKLLQQIADKETEIDVLIKLSVKDLWSRDLDDFIAEWRFQIDDDKKRQRKVANLGRRASNKLKIGAKGPAAKKRKAQGDDPDDSDFGVAKSKKTTTKVQNNPGAGAAFFRQFSPPSKSSTAAAKPAANGVKKETNASFGLDGTSDGNSEDEKPKPLDVGKEPIRKARAAARKPVKYGGSSDEESDSDNGDDMLGDVSQMVKTVGVNLDGPKPGSRPLFSTSASRRGSSVGPAKAKPKGVSRIMDDHSDNETDFSKLIPQTSLQKLAGRTGKSASLSDDEDEDSLDFAAEKKVVSKPTAKPAAKAVAAAKAKKVPAKKSSTAQSAPTKSGPAALSPAAKAYAAKQAKKKLAASANGDDVEAIADDLLDSAGDDEPDSPAPRKTTSRPARRAVAAKKKPVYLDSESEGEESELEASEDFSGSE